MSLDRTYFESLSLRDLRGLLEGAGVSSPAELALRRKINVVRAGTSYDVVEALLRALVEAADAGWFNGEGVS